MLRLSAFLLRLASLFVIALVSFSKGHVILRHPPYPTIFPSSMRIIRSARRAISLLCVIITTVCRNSALVRLISPNTSALVLLSRLPVGSSASTIAGLVIRAGQSLRAAAVHRKDYSAIFSVYLPNPTNKQSRSKTLSTVSPSNSTGRTIFSYMFRIGTRL